MRCIPQEARIPVVARSKVTPANEVREQFKRVRPLKDVSIAERGWTLDVLNLVRRIVECGDMSPLSKRGHVRAVQNEFTNGEVYAHAEELEQLHPDNRSLRTATT